MDNDEYIQAFDKISEDSGKIQAVCRLAIDPADSRADPDIQTALYIIADYANQIKILANKVMM